MSDHEGPFKNSAVLFPQAFLSASSCLFWAFFLLKDQRAASELSFLPLDSVFVQNAVIILSPAHIQMSLHVSLQVRAALYRIWTIYSHRNNSLCNRHIPINCVNCNKLLAQIFAPAYMSSCTDCKLHGFDSVLHRELVVHKIFT